MEWLAEIFQSNSEKARLITIAASAAIAVLIVFLNQYFSLRKSRNELLVSKIEELYKVILSYEKKTTDLSDTMSQILEDNVTSPISYSSDFTIQNLDISGQISKIHEEVDTMSMLFALYFPNCGYDSSDLYIGSSVPSAAAYGHQVDWAKLHVGAEGVAIKADNLKKICRELMRKHSH